jgi:DNA-binding CsgD family transcriptional regulator
VKHLSNSVVVAGGTERSFRVLHLVREVGGRPADRRSPGGPLSPPEPHPPLGRLTRRELEVLRIFATGSTNGEIAASLGLSAFTVRNHLASIQRKLGARGRAGIVILAMRAGLI